MPGISRHVFYLTCFLSHRKLRFPMRQKPSDKPKVCWMQHARTWKLVADAAPLGSSVSQARRYFRIADPGACERIWRSDVFFR